MGRRLPVRQSLPQWMAELVTAFDGAPMPDWVLHATAAPPPDARPSAVLMLLSDGERGPDLLLTRRAATLRTHAGQPAFPGGAIEPGEDAVVAALREAREETGLAEGGVIPTAALPALYLRPSGYLVTPVLAYARDPGPLRVVDSGETDRVVRAPVAQLADPACRGTVTLGALRTPAFIVDDFVVWGFTAGLVDLVVRRGGWERPWDRRRALRPGGVG